MVQIKRYTYKTKVKTLINVNIQTIGKRSLNVAVSMLILLSLVTLMHSSANAAQLTNRSATIDAPNPGSSTVQVIFGFTIPANATVQSLTYHFCTTPLGTCTLPTGLDARTSTTHVAQTGFPANATAFAPRNLTTDTAGCLQSTASFACYNRTAATAGTGAVTHTIGGLTAPSVAGTVYIRMTTYSDNAYTTAVDTGVVAVSFNQRITINARVLESLTFCIGTTTTNTIGSNGNDALRNAGDTADVTSCSLADGTSVDLGVISSTATSITPVAASPNGGDARNAYALLSTNANNGVIVAYQVVQDGATGGRLKVPGVTCTGSSILDAGSSSNDQCFNSSTTQTALANGVEEFGMTIGGVACFNVPTAVNGGYTCDYSTGTVNLRPQSGYIGGTFVPGTSGTYDTTTGFAWQQTGAAVTIASSAASTIKVVASEALIIRFGAAAGVVTPTGSYTTSVDFIATPTF